MKFDDGCAHIWQSPYPIQTHLNKKFKSSQRRNVMIFSIKSTYPMAEEKFQLPIFIRSQTNDKYIRWLLILSQAVCTLVTLLGDKFSHIHFQFNYFHFSYLIRKIQAKMQINNDHQLDDQFDDVKIYYQSFHSVYDVVIPPF